MLISIWAEAAAERQIAKRRKLRFMDRVSDWREGGDHSQAPSEESRSRVGKPIPCATVPPTPEIYCTLLLVRRGPLDPQNDTLALGQHEVGISATARAIEPRVAQALRAKSPQRLVSSDSERARASAERIAESLGCPLAVRKDLREQDLGDFEGRHWPAIVASSPAAAVGFLNHFATARPPHGETLSEVQARSVRGLKLEAKRHPKGVVAYLGHAGVIRTAAAHFLGLTLEQSLRLALDPFSLSVLDIRGPHTTLALWNSPL